MECFKAVMSGCSWKSIASACGASERSSSNSGKSPGSDSDKSPGSEKGPGKTKWVLATIGSGTKGQRKDLTFLSGRGVKIGRHLQRQGRGTCRSKGVTWSNDKYSNTGKVPAVVLSGL